MVEQALREHFERDVLARLGALRGRLRLYLLLDGLAIVGVAVLASMLITFLVDRTFWLARDMRAVQLTTLLMALGSLAWYFAVRPLRRPVRDEELALLVESRFPHLNSRLVSAVDFVAAPRASDSASSRSAVMVRKVVRETQEQVRELDFNQTLAHPRARRRASVVLACLLAIAMTTALARDTARLWFHRNVLLRNIDWPLRNRLTIEGLKDGRVLVARGDDVTVSAVVDEGYERPRQAYISYEGSEGIRGREQMPAVEADPSTSERVRFTHTFERIDTTLTCRIVGGDARTEPFTIEVVERPRVTDVVIGITPPHYTHLEAYELRAGQTVGETLKGSNLRFRVRTNKPLSAISLVRQTTGDEIEIGAGQRIGPQEYVATDLPDATASYYFRMVDEDGFSNLSERSPPVRLSVRLIADKPPRVKMRVRGAGEMITPQAVLPIEMDFSDTYGLASARLVHALARPDSKPAIEPLPGFEAGTKTFAHTLDWTATSHGLTEGDRLTLHADATDFDNVSGPNLGESPPTVLRVVSREELLAELNRREQEYRQEFERLLRSQEELYGSVLSMVDPAAQRQRPQDRSRRFAQMARLQRDYGGRLNSMRLQFEQILSELRINALSSPTIESRLGGGIVEPMTVLSRTQVPEAADDLERLGRSESPETTQAARDAQASVVADMQRILANMLKWEGFQEAVGLLREVLKMQGNITQETEKRIEAEVFGTEPASRPSKP